MPNKILTGKSKGKLGAKKNSAVVTKQTEERRKDVAAIFEEKGWEYKIDLEPDEPEEITALEVLLNTPKTKIAEKKIWRNALCPCGSGQKHKRCCGR